MKYTDTGIAGMFTIEPMARRDDRGYFMETYRKDALDAVGTKVDFMQHNETESINAGTIRGYHFQVPGYNRLARVVRGMVYFSAVDLRVGSPSYAKTDNFIVSEMNMLQVFIPGGVAWAYCTMEEHTKLVYMAENTYHPEADRTIHWTSCDAKWPTIYPKTISERDAAGVTLRDYLASDEGQTLLYA